LHADLCDTFVHRKGIGWPKIIIALRELLYQADVPTQLGAATVLLRLGRAEDEAARAFVRVLEGNDWDQRFQAVLILSLLEQVSEATVPTLVKLLRGNDPTLKVAAASALRDVPDLPEAVPILSQALRNHDEPGMVMMAASAFGRMGVRASEAVQALLTLLRQTDKPEMTAGIVSLLSGMKERAREAGPTLLGMLESPATDQPTHKAIIAALGEMGLGSAARKALLRALQSENWVTVCMAGLSLKDLGEMPRKLRERLEELLSHADAEARGAAALVIGEFGPEAAETMPTVFRRAIHELNVNVLTSLGNAVTSIGLPVLTDNLALIDEVMGVLIERLRAERDIDRFRILVWFVAMLGTHAVPRLISLARSKDFDSMRVTVASLAAMGMATPEPITRVVVQELISQDDSFVRLIGVSVLAEMGPDAVKAVPSLAGLLDAGDEDVCPDVFRALRAIGPEAGEAAPALVRMMLGKHPSFSTQAESLLLIIGAGAVTALEHALAEADEKGKSRLTLILNRIGKPVIEGIERDFDFALIGEDAWLETFAFLGQIMRARGPTSLRAILEDKDVTLPKDTPWTDRGIWKHIENFEKRLQILCKDNSIRLIDRQKESRKKGGLTDFGERLLPKVLKYLKEVAGGG
jgi:HEAT repeat protein